MLYSLIFAHLKNYPYLVMTNILEINSYNAESFGNVIQINLAFVHLLKSIWSVVVLHIFHDTKLARTISNPLIFENLVDCSNFILLSSPFFGVYRN